MHSSVRLLVLAQACLWAGLLACVLLIPHFLFEADEGGVSNYGVYAKTVVPYTLAFGLCGLLTLRAARVLPARAARYRSLRWILSSTGWLYLAVLESTYLYQANAVLDGVHVSTGVALFVFQVAVALWSGHAFARDALQVSLLALQLVSFLLSALTLFGLLHVLFVTEVLASLSFGVLLIWLVRQATSVGLPKTGSAPTTSP